MELFGMPIVQVYLVVLIIAGLATLLYIFFSDMAEGIGEASPFLDPAVVLAFITFAAAVGYILELVTAWNQWHHFSYCACYCICTRFPSVFLCASSIEIGGSVACLYG